MTAKNIWLEFEQSQIPTIIIRNRLTWYGSIFLTRISIASYVYDEGSLIVWSRETTDPNMPVMFLINYLGSTYKAAYPHHIVTDGEKWCPLIQGNRHKWRSYPGQYYGSNLTTEDQQRLCIYIESYISEITEDQT